MEESLQSSQHFILSQSCCYKRMVLEAETTLSHVHVCNWGSSQNQPWKSFSYPEGEFLRITGDSTDIQLTSLSFSPFLCRYYTPGENSHEQGRPVKQAIAGVSFCCSLFHFLGKYSCLLWEIFALFTYVYCWVSNVFVPLVFPRESRSIICVVLSQRVSHCHQFCFWTIMSTLHYTIFILPL